MTQFDDSLESRKSTSSPSPQTRILGCGVSLILLLISGSIAAGLGILVALTNPEDTAEKPILVQLWERLNPQPQPATPPTPTTPSSPASPTQPDPQQLQTQIANLQQQLTTLQQSTNDLEQQLNIQPPSQDLQQRLAALQEQIQQLPTPTPTPTTPPSLPNPTNTPLPGQLKFTFSNELIFDENGNLSNEGRSLLDNVLDNIKKNVSQYQGSTIRIAGHTNTAETPAENRDLSFQQARLVEQYLTASIPNTVQDKYRWVSIGYGQTRPLNPQDDTKNPGNQRLEIAVD
ncbi:OmpA family protein [Spirulina sp. CS-785/01]|uniref:OmpA family protein n=1 Tax=Spirulina sp. CS-785/01 TaxID=3021716 RepID=UPI00233108B5|nr:OmpA family protein [Spirulina sp. CS-785/01]MDB9313215.1 OmpA family protein [Spirulina sp. CS-785/01]